MRRSKKRWYLVGLVCLSSLGLIFAFSHFAESSSSAKSVQRSICVNKETRELKLRKDCRQNESFLVEAEVFTKGGKSAYETWLDLGNKGTPAQFIASLAGASGGGSTYNPLANRNCADAIWDTENRFAKSVYFKDVWDYIEQNSSCRIDQTQMNLSYWDPELNNVTSGPSVTVLRSSSKVVTRYNNKSADYEVPVRVSFSLNLRDGWIVCTPSHPLFGNTNFTTSAEFARWQDLESNKVSGTNSYAIAMTAFVSRQGISLGRKMDDSVPNPQGQVALCRQDATSNLGWRLYLDYPYFTWTSPSVFKGLNIHYVSQWGWE